MNLPKMIVPKHAVNRRNLDPTGDTCACSPRLILTDSAPDKRSPPFSGR